MKEKISVKICNSDKAKPGTVHIKNFSPKERRSRTLKTLALCWGLAAVSILLPIAHFVLVPGFFIAGIIAPFYVYDVKAQILGGEGTCPKCGAPFDIQKGSDKWPLSDTCAQCHAAVTIKRA